MKTSSEAEHEKLCKTARLLTVIGYIGKDNDDLELKGASKLLINYGIIELLSEQCSKKKQNE